MGNTFTRREALLGLTASAGTLLAARRQSTIETHVHLFDPTRVPYSPNAPYKPPAYTLEDHLKLVEAASLAHSIIVHPEPYQDDHRYLDYCLEHEPRPGYFKATCLFDPLRADTPGRMRALAERWPRRIVALRIHEMSMTPEAGGPIRNRDMKDPRMTGLLAGRSLPGDGGADAFCTGAGAEHPRVSGQISGHHRDPGSHGPAGTRYGEGVRGSAEAGRTAACHPEVFQLGEYKGDLNRLTRRLYNAFGPERIIWGTLGNTAADYRKLAARFEELLAFAAEADRANIRGGNAQRLFFG